MILLLAIIAALGWLVALWLYLSRREERGIYIDLAAQHIRLMLDYDQDTADLREMVNKERRNSGKAEM